MSRDIRQTSNMKIHYEANVKPEIPGASWVLRITEHKDKPVPVFIVKERILPDKRTDIKNLVAPRSILKERGLIYGQAQLRCLPIIRKILARVCNGAGIPLDLQHYLNGSRIRFRGNLPLDMEAGYKLALISKLQERLKDLNRVELIARRVDRFTREEAAYWYSRVTNFSPPVNRWALAGMKIMLAGYPNDPNLESMLEELRQGY